MFFNLNTNVMSFFDNIENKMHTGCPRKNSPLEIGVLLEKLHPV